MELRQTSLLGSVAMSGVCQDLSEVVNFDLPRCFLIGVVGVCRGFEAMLNKQQAAEFLGVNVRTLERYTQEGKIGSRYEKGKTRSVVVYDEEELRAFKAAQETKTYKPAVDPTPTNPDSDEAALSKFVEGTQLHLLTGLDHKRGCVGGNT